MQTDRLDFFADSDPEYRDDLGHSLDPVERSEFEYNWPQVARRQQVAPDGDWRVWLVMAGRGFGKTRCGAEWVRLTAEADPNARIALIGASLVEARSVMVEGESGVIACCPPHRAPRYEPSLRRLTWDNGAQAILYSAGEPEALRGPQHSHAWCDEVGKWSFSGGHATRTWDNLLLGLRLGESPRIVATTTPRAVPLLRRLLNLEEIGEVAVTRGRTVDNNEALTRADSLLHATLESEIAAPPATPQVGQIWLIGATPTGLFAGHAASLAGWTADGWRFLLPRDGLRVFDSGIAAFRIYRGGWRHQVTPNAPAGGTTIDTEARTVITLLLERLVDAGVFATS